MEGIGVKRKGSVRGESQGRAGKDHGWINIKTERLFKRTRRSQEEDKNKRWAKGTRDAAQAKKGESAGDWRRRRKFQVWRKDWRERECGAECKTDQRTLYYTLSCRQSAARFMKGRRCSKISINCEDFFFYFFYLCVTRWRGGEEKTKSGSLWQLCKEI